MLNLCKFGLFWNVCAKLLFIKCYISIFLQCIQWTSWVWIPFANISVERSLPVCMPSQNLWRCYCLFGFGSPSSQPSSLLSWFFFVFCSWCLVNVFVTCGFLMLTLLHFKGAWIIIIFFYSFQVSYFFICISGKWSPLQPCLIITIIPFRSSFLRWEAIQMWPVQLCGLKPARSDSSCKASAQRAKASDLPAL